MNNNSNNGEVVNYDLFGDPVIEKSSLKNRFIIPPFSILDTLSGDWQNRKNRWRNLGIESEAGRGTNLLKFSDTLLQPDPEKREKYKKEDGWVQTGLTFASGTPRRDEVSLKLQGSNSGTSIFDPVLCELMYHWFTPEKGSILDPFAGGSVRGIVAQYLGYEYTGIELREEQVAANRKQGVKITPGNAPTWICGDSNIVLDDIYSRAGYDFIFSCPPYYDLEVYCEDPRDLSNMDYDAFDIKYRSIIKKAAGLLKNNRFACFVVGNVRDKSGAIKNLVGVTIDAFEKCGLSFYNDLILKNAVGSGALRAGRNMRYRKVVKNHQNVLVFCKGDAKKGFGENEITGARP